MDMLVRLYDLKQSALEVRLVALAPLGVDVRRAMAFEKSAVVSFVRDYFTAGFSGWPSECEVSFSRSPVACRIAVHQKRLVGFACFDCTWKGFFGPTGVIESLRGQGIGAALLLASLLDMRAAGYAYAVIGAANTQPGFYERVAGAVPIPGSDPGPYPQILESLKT